MATSRALKSDPKPPLHAASALRERTEVPLQEIRELAYRIYQARKGGAGNAQIDWMEAERILRRSLDRP